jgi:hypothetical protein
MEEIGLLKKNVELAERVAKLETRLVELDPCTDTKEAIS